MRDYLTNDVLRKPDFFTEAFIMNRNILDLENIEHLIKISIFSFDAVSLLKQLFRVRKLKMHHYNILFSKLETPCVALAVNIIA